ncbi:MAG: hypothetical protein GF393_10200 [Armatimonadia bacterium]|nr:hypothetical protein [Armatimonadia bacterium]
MRRLPALLCTLLLMVPVLADELPEVSVAVQPQSVTIGDVIEVTVAVTLPQGHLTTLAGRDADLGGVEVRSADTSSEVLEAGDVRHTAVYEATVWEVGEITVESPPIAVRAPDGEAYELERSQATLTVRSVLPEGAEEIRDIRAPKEMPLRWTHYALAALPVIGLLGLVVLLIWWLRRRRGEEETPQDTTEPQLPPAEEALEALLALQNEDLPEQGRIKEHYVRLSWILRNYVERRWSLPALEETTGMLRHTMLGSGRLQQTTAERITEVLRRADLAKFAKHRPQANIAMADVVVVRDIVYATRPAQEVAEGAGHDEPLASPAN